MNRRLIAFLVSVAAGLGVWGTMPSAITLADGPNVVISQVYGAGGNAGATYQNDYVVLYNRGTATASLSGWSIQYTSATGNGLFSAFVTSLSGSIAPGQYYLVQQAGGTNGAPLPTADVTGTITMAAGAGKVILANTTTGLACNGSSTVCPPAQLAQIVDLVGYGNANFYEGASAAPTISTTTADFRSGAGCGDTDNNGADFAAAAPAPRNTASPISLCTCNSQSTGNWSNPARWSCGNPAATALVIIHGNHIISLDATVNVSVLDVNAGGALTSSGNILTATGTLTNNGTLTQTLLVIGSTNVDFFNTGNYGGVILNANSSDLGSTTVVIKGNQACNTSDDLVHRCFNIIPATATGRNATITFAYADGERNSNNCSTMNAFHWNSLTTSWEGPLTLGTRGCASSPYTLTVTNVATFSPFGLTSRVSPLAVTLYDIKAAPSFSPIVWLILVASIVLLSGVFFILRRRSRSA